MIIDSDRYFPGFPLFPSLFKFFSAALRSGGLVLLFVWGVLAQDLPNEIRGYKVYKAKINVQNQSAEPKSKTADAIINLDDPEPVDVSSSGITFEISGKFSTLKQSGQVDFLVFRDFRVNGLKVEIEEYNRSFAFEKNQAIKLPKPIKVSLSFAQAARGAFKEWRESKEVWQVTGTIFIFGRFKKAGFRFKRVIPIDVSLQIKNPLLSDK